MMLPTDIPPAAEMASALEACVTKLMDVGIVEQDSTTALSLPCARLRGLKQAKKWSYSISEGTPIIFALLEDRKGCLFQPHVSVEDIVVDDATPECALRKWNVVLKLQYVDNNIPSPRWHFDLGNSGQDGPRMHLQYGGHGNEDRALDEALKVPRWNAMLMDTLLVLETVAANFYHDQWKEHIRHDAGWNYFIKLSEKLCYPVFVNKLYEHLNASGSNSVLHGCWNDTWLDKVS